jgi:hypothetical protein
MYSSNNQMEACMALSMSAKKTSDKKDKAKEDRRSNVDRRRFSYTEHIPERRSNDDRRKDENEDENSGKAKDS